jgi:WD40 repeat protein
VSKVDHNKGVKSGTFAASPSNHCCYAFVDLEGKLSVLDLEKQKVFWSVKAHDGIANSVDGAGGEGNGYGSCELVTGGRDGCVRLWDPRQNSPVLSLEPVEK